MDAVKLHLFAGCLIGFIFFIHESHGAAAKPVRSAWTQQSFSTGKNYMQKYGWMPPPDPEASALITEMEMRRSIAQMQRFYGLQQTGMLDDETMKKMESPRCGVSDNRVASNRFRHSRYAINPDLKWNKNDLTYSFENYTPDMRQADIRASIESALKVWSDVTPLRFREVSKSVTADIEIGFTQREHGDGFVFDGRGGTLAHAFFPGIGIGGDAHFDEDEYWRYNTDVDGIDLFTVAAHELGHSLGLGHSDEPTALMAPFYQGYDPDFQLHWDDIYGVQSLYGSNPRPPSRPDEPEEPDVAFATEPPPAPTTAPETPEDPVCSTHFDAISTIRGELFLFKGDEMWRTSQDGTLYPGYPTDIALFWKNVDKDVTAVFERKHGRIIFVKGHEYLEYEGLTPTHDRPKPMTDFGLPRSISIDAAVPNHDKGKIDFFFEKEVWRYDEYSAMIDEGFPMNIKKVWDIGNDLSAAFRFKDKTFFVKSKRYWELDDATDKIKPGFPRYLSVDFLGCQPPKTDDPETDTATGNHSSRTFASHLLLFISAIFAYRRCTLQ